MDRIYSITIFIAFFLIFCQSLSSIIPLNHPCQIFVHSILMVRHCKSSWHRISFCVRECIIHSKLRQHGLTAMLCERVRLKAKMTSVKIEYVYSPRRLGFRTEIIRLRKITWKTPSGNRSKSISKLRMKLPCEKCTESKLEYSEM